MFHCFIYSSIYLYIHISTLAGIRQRGMTRVNMVAVRWLAKRTGVETLRVASAVRRSSQGLRFVRRSSSSERASRTIDDRALPTGLCGR